MALETPGTTLARDAGGLARERLFASTSEDERVARLQADDRAARGRGRQVNDERVDGALRDGWTAWQQAWTKKR